MVIDQRIFTLLNPAFSLTLAPTYVYLYTVLYVLCTYIVGALALSVVIG